MKKISIFKQATAFFVIVVASTVPFAPVAAQNAPGEDPVVLTNRIGLQMQFDGGVARSRPLNNGEMPASMRAKIARYEAMANAGITPGISTDADVTRETSSDGFQKTCIQEVGSTTAAVGAGASGRVVGGNNQQVVVLKGDLVNICK